MSLGHLRVEGREFNVTDLYLGGGVFHIVAQRQSNAVLSLGRHSVTQLVAPDGSSLFRTVVDMGAQYAASNKGWFTIDLPIQFIPEPV